MRHWQDLAWPQFEEGEGPSVALLPIGSLEAHGPHLPVGTDVLISEAMAREGARALAGEGYRPLLLPAIPYSPAPFAEEFTGTLSIRPTTLTALLVDLARSLAKQRVAALAIANSHFDPANLDALAAARDDIQRDLPIRFAYPDLTRRKMAERLTEEFRSGACHAGRYETSILLAERPDLVHEGIRHKLDEVPVSLVEAIRAGKRTFRQAGGPNAYFGAPAHATVAEGRATVALLGEILAEAVRAAFA